jgi:hypothetical protein
MSFNKGTNVTKRANQAVLEQVFNLNLDDAHKINDRFHYFIKHGGKMKYINTTQEIPPADTNLYTNIKLSYNDESIEPIDKPNLDSYVSLQKGFVKDGIIYGLLLVYNSIASYEGLGIDNLVLNSNNEVKAWLILQFDVETVTYNIINIIPHEGAVDGDHSLIYTKNTVDGNPKYIVCGRARRSVPDWGASPTGNNITINPSTYYTISNDPRKNEDSRVINFDTAIWDDRRGVKFYQSNSLTGTFEDAAVRGSGNTYLSGYADPRQIYTNYDSSTLKQDTYGTTAFVYKNYNFYLTTIYFKDQNRYSPIRKDRVTGDGSMAPQVIFTKNNVNFHVVKDYPEGVTDSRIIEGKSLVSDDDFKRIWYTPTPSAYYSDATTEQDLFRDANNLSDLLNRTFAGPPEIGQIYIHNIWESSDGNYWYMSINDAARPHYHAGATGEWYITGQGGTVTYGGSAPNRDITGSITFRITQIQNSYKWQHLSEMLSRADSVNGNDYTFNSVDKVITVNGKTKSLKAHLAEEVPVNKWPFYRWVKHSLNYFKDGSYGLNKEGKEYIIKIRKEAFSYITKTVASGANSAHITTKLFEVNPEINYINVNAQGSFKVQLLDVNNSSLGYLTINGNDTFTGDGINKYIPLPTRAYNQFKLRFYLLTTNTKLFAFKFYKPTNSIANDPNIVDDTIATIAAPILVSPINGQNVPESGTLLTFQQSNGFVVSSVISGVNTFNRYRIDWANNLSYFEPNIDGSYPSIPSGFGSTVNRGANQINNSTGYMEVSRAFGGFSGETAYWRVRAEEIIDAANNIINYGEWSSIGTFTIT